MAVLSYDLRIQKEIERRIFLDILSFADRRESLRDAVYIGLGSVYFEDFKAIHDRFGVERMICLEREPWLRERQKFNLPLSCIQLPGLSVEEFLDEFQRERRSIVWLDLDGFESVGQHLRGFDHLLRNLQPGDVAKITLDASYAKLKNKAEREAKKAGKFTPAKASELTAWVVKDMLGKYCPAGPEFAVCLKNGEYGDILLRAAIVASERALARRDLAFCPLAAFLYSDSPRSEMLTLTGIISESGEDAAGDLQMKEFPFRFNGKPYPISPLPIMTPGEKMAADKNLPLRRGKGEAAKAHKELTDLGVQFDEDKEKSLRRFEKYAALYRYHPDYRKIRP